MEFNIDPYYDDFEDNAKDNNYVRILFKPGRAVQARELTQIQSILQNQIKQFGDHVFQDGSPVIGGNITLDNKVTYLKLLETYNNQDVEVEEFNGRIIRNSSGGIQAKVVATFFPDDGVPTLIVKYLTGSQFADGDVITLSGTTTQAQLIGSNASGPSTVVSINEGVFYVDGFFVQVADQTVVAQAYGTSPNVKVGLEIDDEIIDSGFDTTLLDPAQGSFNYQAPGGDRYQFSLTLSTRPLNSIVDQAQFFELMRLENGIITKQVKYPVYAELEKTLARRTFDESGDYTVRPFRATILDASDANNYVVSIEPGKAYVKGFEFETIGTVKVEVEKPRSSVDVKSIIDVDVDTSSGNFLYVTSIVSPGQGNAFINIASLEKVDIHCGTATQINVGLGSSASNGQIYQNTKIGTARVRDFIREDNSSEATDSNGIYRLYLTDVAVSPKVLNAAGGTHTANTINIASGIYMPRTNGLYSNVSLSILPIKLDAVDNVYVAFANAFTVNANNDGTFAGKVNVGDVIRIGQTAKEVTAVSAGDLTVNSIFTQTFANSATNPVQIYVQRPHSQNVTGQSRTVSNSWWQLNYFTVQLDRPFDNLGVPDSNTVVQLNFGVDDAECIVGGVAVANSLLANVNVAMNVSIDSKLINGDVVLEDSTNQTFIYELPGTFVQRTSINNADYIYDKVILNRTPVSGSPGVFTIDGTALSADESIPWARTNSSIRDNLIVMVRDKGSSSTPNGTILNLTTANVTSVTSGSVTIDTGDVDLQSVDIIVRVKLDDAEDLIRTKSYYAEEYAVDPFTYPTATTHANTTVTHPELGEVAKIDIANGLIWLTNTSYNAVRPGDSISLFVPDVVAVNKVLLGTTTTLPDEDNYQDITSHFKIDYGQRDNKYDHARLVLKQGYNAPDGKILVHINFYHHFSSLSFNKISFFGPASYSAEQYNNNQIPTYTSSANTVYNLRDCLDFRPSRPVGDVSDLLSAPNMPNPDSTTELSFSYYLPRIDKLVLSKDKEFRIIKGKSAVIPSPPKDDDEAMTLYTFYLPPYVSDVRNIRTEYVENKRFTMKDISSLDKRIEKLEFFVSLNNVENIAVSDKTLYEDNTEKEKYGIVGENFKTFNIADFSSSDFNCALNADGGVSFLTPRTITTPLLFKHKSSLDIAINKKTITLDYTETPAITQNVCSDKAVSVQPFLFGQFNGIVELVPETDFWTDSQLKPEIITVPERIIEHTTVIREKTIEKETPITIVNVQPVVNVVTVIVGEPYVEPTPALPPDITPVVNPPAPPPVVPDPVDPPIVTPPEPPEPPPLPFPPPELPTPPTIIDYGDPEIPLWVPKPPIGGGGCVVLESFIPLVDGSIVNGKQVDQAYLLSAGYKISLAKEDETLENIIGEVKHLRIDLQPCVRVTTENNVSLVCSLSAPLFTQDLIFVDAPDTMDKYIAVMVDGATSWDKVVKIEEVGDKFVAVIDAGGTAFWAGEEKGKYILHHNINAGIKGSLASELVSYDKK